MAGLSFVHPGYLLLVALPLAWGVAAWSRAQASLPLPTFEAALASVGRPDRSDRALVGLRILATMLVVLAIADPQVAGRPAVDRRFGLDIMLALDISGSMAAQDLEPSRVEAAKRVLEDFIARSHDDRVGLVVFKARALTLCPLTTETSVVASALSQVTLATLADDGTAIGDAIGTCLNRLAGDRPPGGAAIGRSQLIVLLTDGENNSGMLAPLEAAAIARSRNVRIDTVAVGKPGGAPVPYTDSFGQQQYVRNPDGSLYLAAVDDRELKEIARLTGGLFFRADDTRGLAAAYEQIAHMARHEIDVHRQARRVDLAGGLLALALVALAAEFWLGGGRFRQLGSLAPSGAESDASSARAATGRTGAPPRTAARPPAARPAARRSCG